MFAVVTRSLNKLEQTALRESPRSNRNDAVSRVDDHAKTNISRRRILEYDRPEKLGGERVVISPHPVLKTERRRPRAVELNQRWNVSVCARLADPNCP
jgi:hypothetical protein